MDEESPFHHSIHPTSSSMMMSMMKMKMKMKMKEMFVVGLEIEVIESVDGNEMESWCL